MKNVDGRRIASILRVSAFGKKWQLDVPPYGAVMKRLHAAAERLPALVYEQSDAHSKWQGGSHLLDLLRIKLRRRHLVKYARVGKKVFEKVPDAGSVFKVPGARASAGDLVAFADAMATFIAKDVQSFLDLQQPADFLDRMRNVTQQMAECQRSIEESVARQVAATAALAKEVPIARQDISIMEGLLEDRLSEGGTFATGWYKARRVGKRMGKPRGGKWNWRTRKEPPN